jgi:hypothetical protein
VTTDVVEAGAERRRLRLPALTREDSEFDLRNTWQIAAGAILMPLGFIVILLGWYGAAHARVVQQQIPYLVSGSFIGLGLMIGGGLMFWAHWLYRIYDQADMHHRELVEAINRLASSGGGPAAGSASDSPAATSAGASQFVATSSGSNFHRPDCSVVARRRGLRKLSASDVEKMEPCRICEPLVHG